jgi:hypothetical protein
MTDNKSTDKTNQTIIRICRSLEGLESSVDGADAAIRKLPGCLDAIHDRLISVETELSKGLKYQSRSVEALESIAKSLRSIAFNYDTRTKILLEQDERL